MLGKPGAGIRIPITVPLREVVFKPTGEIAIGAGEKLQGSLGFGPEATRLPYLPGGKAIAPGRLINLYERRSALWGRYE